MRLVDRHLVTIDVTRLLFRYIRGRLPTGVDRVSLAYLAHYRNGARALVGLGRHSCLFSERVSGRLLDLLIAWPARGESLAMRLLGLGVVASLVPFDARQRFLFNTGHMGLERAGVAQVFKRHNVRPVFFLHDLIPILHPEFCRPGEARRHTTRLTTMLQLGTGVIVNSDATLNDLVQFAERASLPLPPTLVAPLAPSMPYTPPLHGCWTPSRPYFVTVGTVEPRKNYLMLLQAWQRLVRRLGSEAPHLVIVGQRGWESENVDDILERSDMLRGHVQVLRKCSDGQLSGLLNGARALLFPSFAEGYGLPLAEALHAAVPVLASDLPAFRQIGRDIPDYLDPLDTLSWISRIAEYCQPESAARKAQLERLSRYDPWTWPKHFAAVDEFLLRLDEPRLDEQR